MESKILKRLSNCVILTCGIYLFILREVSVGDSNIYGVMGYGWHFFYGFYSDKFSAIFTLPTTYHPKSNFNVIAIFNI